MKCVQDIQRKLVSDAVCLVVVRHSIAGIRGARYWFCIGAAAMDVYAIFCFTINRYSGVLSIVLI